MKAACAAAWVSCAAVVASILGQAQASHVAPPRSPKPHVLMVVVDDWGWGNTGFHRGETSTDPGAHEWQTPNIDVLVDEGILLQRHYVHAFCSPTRSALQTGRLPVHVQLTLANPCNHANGVSSHPSSRLCTVSTVIAGGRVGGVCGFAHTLIICARDYCVGGFGGVYCKYRHPQEHDLNRDETQSGRLRIPFCGEGACDPPTLHLNALTGQGWVSVLLVWKQPPTVSIPALD